LERIRRRREEKERPRRRRERGFAVLFEIFLFNYCYGSNFYVRKAV
jgi:hypothetical protein